MVLIRKAPDVDLRGLILEKLSEYDVMRYYIGTDIKINTAFRSCLHPDKGKPSMSIGVTRSGHLQWNDYSIGESGGCMDLVQRLYGITYQQALQKVAKDFGLTEEGSTEYKKIIVQYQQPVIEEVRHSSIIHVTVRKGYKKADIQYWGQYLITEEELQKEGIYSVTELYINRKRIPIDKNERVYAYQYPDDKYKIYMPDRPKGEKWKMNVSNTHVENLENLNGDAKVLIAKSKKDRICLQQIVSYPVLSVQNEGMTAWTEEFRQRLQDKEVVIMYDSDDPGVRNCKKICDTYGYKYVNTPRHLLLQDNVKDGSDWIKKEKSREPLKEFLTSKSVI